MRVSPGTFFNNPKYFLTQSFNKSLCPDFQLLCIYELCFQKHFFNNKIVYQMREPPGTFF